MRNMRGGSHAVHFDVASTTMLMGTNRKAQQSCGSGTVREWGGTPGSRWDTQVPRCRMSLLTKATTINTLEGSRLQPRDVLDASQPTRVGHQPYVGAKGEPDGQTKNQMSSKNYQSKRASNKALCELSYPKVMWPVHVRRHDVIHDVTVPETT